MMPLCFIDTETTGLHQDKQLWEVAIIRREYGIADAQAGGIPVKTETRYEAFVPVDLSNADLFGLNVGRFYERHPMGRSLSGRTLTSKVPATAYQIADDVARFTHGARFIAAVPSFDAEVLGKFLRKHELLPAWHYHLIDVCELAIGYVRGVEASSDPVRGETKSISYDEDGAKMDELASWLGLPPISKEDRHTAMGDALQVMAFWDAVMG